MFGVPTELRNPQDYPRSIQNIMHESKEARKQINLPHYIINNHADYLCSIPCATFVKKAAHVTVCTLGGAAVGGVAGAIGGGVGAGPGAGIGAAVGLTVGVCTMTIFDIADGYVEWKRGQKKEVIDQLNKKLVTALKEMDFECTISSELPHYPVRSPYADNVYERDVLEKWVNNRGTCPATGLPMDVSMIRSSLQTFGMMKKLCDFILKNEIQALKFSPSELRGVRLMQKDFNDNIMKFFKAEQIRIGQEVESGEMSFMDAAKTMMAFALQVEGGNAAEGKGKEKGDGEKEI